MRSVSLAVFATAVWASELSAHHSVLGFDNKTAVTLRGVVSDVVWANPHAYIAVDVSEGPRRGQRWIIESESPNVLKRLGWTAASITRGDRIVSIGAPDKRGDHLMRCQTITIPGGAKLPCYPAGA